MQDEQTFTASTADLVLPSNPYIDSLDVSLRSTTATAAVLTKTLLDTLNPLEIKLNNTAISSIRGSDLAALDALLFGIYPIIGETTAVGSTGKVEGLIMPVWGQSKHGSWTTRANFVAGTNLSAGVISLESELVDKVLQDGYLSALTTFFTPPSTSSFNDVFNTTMNGDLIGLLVFSTTVPTFAADTISAREVRLFVDDGLAWQVEWKNLTAPGISGGNPNPPVVGTVFSQGFTNFYQNYGFYDNLDDPIPKGKKLKLQVSSDDTSTIRVIPLLKVK